MAGSKTGKVPPAPGGMIAPHQPGMIPDWTTVPTHIGEVTPPALDKVRPLSQYGTAEALTGVFTRKPSDQLEPTDFEQAPASFEELRKTSPSNLTPIRPLPPLGQLAAIEPGADKPVLAETE